MSAAPSGGCPFAKGEAPQAFGWSDQVGERMEFRRYKDRKVEGEGERAKAKAVDAGAGAGARSGPFFERKNQDGQTPGDARKCPVDHTKLATGGAPADAVHRAALAVVGSTSGTSPGIHSNTTPPSQPSIIPSSLQSTASSHPLSTAFLLGSATTLTFLTGAWFTRSLLASAFRTSASASAAASRQAAATLKSSEKRFDDLERRIVDHLQAANRDRRIELQGFRLEILRQMGATQPPKVMSGPTGLHGPRQGAVSTPTPPFPSPMPSTPTPSAVNRDTMQSPSVTTLSATPPRDGVQSKPFVKVSSTSSHRIDGAAPTPETPRKKLYDLSFGGLRAGIGRHGPMPIVDPSNPNFITYVEAEEGEKPKPRE